MDLATQGAAEAAAPPTVDSIAGLFEAELKAEAAPPREPRAPSPEGGEIETEPPETEVEPVEEAPVEETEITEEPEPEGESEETPAARTIDAPSGMSEADKAAFAKLSPELRAWVSKRESESRADYTRKSQEVAEQRKAVTAASQQVVGKLQQLDAFLAQFTDPEIAAPDPALRFTDPAAYEEQAANFLHRKDLQEKAKAERSRVAQEANAYQQAQAREYLAQEAQELARLAPDLAANTPKAADMRKAVHRYGVEQGYPPEMLMQASARDVVTLWKAQQFDAAQKARANAKVVQRPAPKIVAPGHGTSVGGRPTNLARAVQDLSKNPSVSALEAAFLAEIQSEKR
jgi:hypothetical protein